MLTEVSFLTGAPLAYEQRMPEMTQFFQGHFLVHPWCFTETMQLLRIYFHFETEITATSLNKTHVPEEKQSLLLQ